MKLILMLLVVWWRRGRPPGAWAWPARWHPGEGTLPWPLLVVLPAAGVAALLWLAGGWFWGLAAHLLALAVLVNCIGGTDWRPALAALAADSASGDLQGVLHRLDELGAGASAGEIRDAAGLPAAAREVLALRFLREWFAVLFWFALLGAPGALAYRCLERLATTSAGAARLLAWAEWPALRTFGLAVAVSGHPGRGMGVWLDSLLARTDAARVAGVYLEAALEPVPEGVTPEAAVATQVQALREVFRRGVLAWLVLVAALLILF